jgi:hypothetical protein
MSHLLHMIFNFVLNCMLLFPQQHAGLSTISHGLQSRQKLVETSLPKIRWMELKNKIWEILKKQIKPAG